MSEQKYPIELNDSQLATIEEWSKNSMVGDIWSNAQARKHNLTIFARQILSGTHAETCCPICSEEYGYHKVSTLPTRPKLVKDEGGTVTKDAMTPIRGLSGHYADHLSTHIRTPEECPTCMRILEQVKQTKPTKRQIVFNWLMGEEDLTKHDGYWGGPEEVARVDKLLTALYEADKQ